MQTELVLKRIDELVISPQWKKYMDQQRSKGTYSGGWTGCERTQAIHLPHVLERIYQRSQIIQTAIFCSLSAKNP